MKTVLFVCVGNAGRSQMAEGFFRSMNMNPLVSAVSAGTAPAEKMSSKVVEVMREVGVDLSKQYPKKLTQDLVEKADLIVTMGCLSHASCPLFLLEDKGNIVDWAIEDPYGKPVEKLREIRDAIRHNVSELIDSEVK